MGKLIKYELRKARTAYGIMLAAIIALQTYFLVSVARDSTPNTITAAILLAVTAYACAIVIFVLGVTTYSNELKQKTSYLIFMTPHSPIVIMLSKLVYTLISTVFFGGLLAAIAYYDINLLAREFEDFLSLYRIIEHFAVEYGISLARVYATIGLSLVTILLNVLCAVVVAYFAITLSATILQKRQGNAIISMILYVAIISGLTALTRSYTDTQAIFNGEKSFQSALLPNILQCVAVIALSLSASGWLLEKKVSL